MGRGDLGGYKTRPYPLCEFGLAVRRLCKVMAPKAAARTAARPPKARPQRAPASSANQPTIGPPKVVVPRKATVQSDMTRPRIFGELSSCRVLLPSEEKLIEKIPTTTRASPESHKLGMKAAAKTANPNSNEAPTSLYGWTPLRLAKKMPPTA